MSVVVFGGNQPHAADEKPGESPWTRSKPESVVCSICKANITKKQFKDGIVEWAPCGHFDHRVCPGETTGMVNLSKCPLCGEDLGHDAKPVFDPDQERKAREEMESRAGDSEKKRVEEDIKRARVDRGFWATMTPTYRDHLFAYAEANGAPIIEYRWSDGLQFMQRNLFRFIRNQYYGQVEALLQKAGVLVNNKGEAAVHGDPEAQNSGRLALVVAAAANDVRMVELLLRYHADVDLTDDFGDCALVQAARNGNADIVAMLLEHGAQTHVKEALAAARDKKVIALLKPREASGPSTKRSKK